MVAKIRAKDIKKTMFQIDVTFYTKLMKMRQLRPDSEFRLEAVQNVVKRLYKFYIEKGGELPDSL